MKIYKQVKKFDPNTGKPLMKKVFQEYRCDYTGEVINTDESQLYCSYSLDYGDSDPCMGSDDDEYKLGEDNSIDVFEFLNSEYHFLQDYPDNFAEKAMMKEFGKKGGMCFHEMCRAARTRTALRLIKEGVIVSDQLSSDR